MSTTLGHDYPARQDHAKHKIRITVRYGESRIPKFPFPPRKLHPPGFVAEGYLGLAARYGNVDFYGGAIRTGRSLLVINRRDVDKVETN